MEENPDRGLQLDAGGVTIAIDPATATIEIREGRFRRILSFDEALLLAVRRFHSPVRTTIARALTRAGDGTSWTAVGVACLASFTARGAHLGLRLGAATGIATLLSQALKRSLTRARPDVSIAGFEPLLANPDRFSFPSGHTAAAFGVAVAFAGESAGVGPLALLLAVGIGLSRVYLGAHYPLDVAAGAVLGVFAGLAARLLVA
ncbi:MAG TPA: phosphatase PAP2 family protein [Anaeromyxobacter sp.]